MDAGWLTPDQWENPDKEGALYHITGVFSKSKEKRFVRLKGNRLFIFEDEECLEMEAHIALTNVDLFATQSFVLKHDPNCFCVFSKTLNQRYFLIASTPEDKEDWIEALQAAISTSPISRSGSETTLLDPQSASQGVRPKKLSKSTAITDPIRTLFITGLPSDVSEREIHNMFRAIPGYEGCRINPGEQPVAFVAFTEQRLAQNAKRIFNGVRFDPFAANILRITYAKQNSKSKALPPEFYPKWHEITGANDEERANRSGSGANSANNSRRSSRSNSTASEDSLADGVTKALANKMETVHEERSSKGTLKLSGDATATGRGTFGAVGERRSSADGDFASDRQDDGQVPVGPNGATPILYIRNLHGDVTEADLVKLFSLMPGFRRLSILKGIDGHGAYVEYDDDKQSAVASRAFTGVLVGASRLKIEFSRHRPSTLSSPAMSPLGSPRAKKPLSLSGESNKAASNLAELGENPQYVPPAGSAAATGESARPLLGSTPLKFGSLF